MRNEKGFTLIELLVVVLIIGILAGIALPQYRMAVTKSRVASILPLMRRWKDALMEYNLQHGNYEVNDASILGVNWPSDWKNGIGNPCENSLYCKNDYWDDCTANEVGTGYVYCNNYNLGFGIYMYQPDDPDMDEIYHDKVICDANNAVAHKVCKALGGELIDGGEDDWGSYSLN